ncbi:MAG: helix-turn-helix domain-containing protein [Hyphomonadaceae bacterium]
MPRPFDLANNTDVLHILHMDLQKLRMRLQAAGLTQHDLAARLGKDRTQVWRLLNGKTRMRVDVLSTIESLIAEAEAERRNQGVTETASAFERPNQIPFITLQEAKASRNKPRARMGVEEGARWLREMAELARAGRNLTAITDMTDDEILGYDESP